MDLFPALPAPGGWARDSETQDLCQSWLSAGAAGVILSFSMPCTNCRCLWALELSCQQLHFPSLFSCSRPWSCLFLFTPVTGPCAAPWPLAVGLWSLLGNFNPLISTWDLSAALQPPSSSWTGKLHLPSTLNCLRRGSLTSPGVSGVVSNSWFQSTFLVESSSSSSPKFLLS